MEKDCKGFGKIIPFPKLKPPALPQANPPNLKTPNSQTLDEFIKDSISRIKSFNTFFQVKLQEIKV